MQEFEIVEFYPDTNKNKDYIGTLHVYHIPSGWDLRGIRVFKSSKGLFFHIPHGYRKVGKETEAYPFACNARQETQKSYMDFLKTEGTRYVTDFLTKRKSANQAEERGQHKPTLDKKTKAKERK